jgi:hypothetical protein
MDHARFDEAYGRVLRDFEQLSRGLKNARWLAV